MKNKTNVFDLVITIILVAICCILAVSIILNMKKDSSSTGMMDGRGMGGAGTGQSQIINVSVTEAVSAPFSKTTRLNGEVISEGKDIEVLPEIAGKVTEILIQKGDYVEQGDTIALVDPSKPGATYKVSAIKATVNGEINDVNVAIGETVTTNTSIATIAGDKTLKISAKIPEKYLGTLTEGMAATFTSVAWTDRIYEATLTYIAPTVDSTSRTVDIELDITGDTMGLKEGMYISLNLITEHIDQCITVPTSAISTFLNDKVVYVAENGVSRRQIVEIGSANDTQTVIVSGLTEGDLVITAGSAGDGVSVNVLE